MSVRVADPHDHSELPEVDLLARLGLRPGASDDQIEAAHDELLDYLQKAPGSLRDWVRGRVLEIDEAYGILNGATLGAGPSHAVPSKPAATQPTAPAAVTPTRPANVSPTASTAQVRIRAGVTSSDALGGDALDGWPDELDEPVVVRRDRRSPKAAQAARDAAPGTVTISRKALRNGGIGGGLIVVAAVAAFAIFQLGNSGVPGINGTPAPGASDVAAATLDTGAVGADMQKLQTNPNDIATLQDLANLYYASGDYQTAQTWLQKILVIDPKNVAALLGYGAAAYNLDDNTTAETEWKAAVAADPTNIEAHYDLGFLYFSETPPNIDGVKAEWNKVLTLNPDDDLKSYIQAHLGSLDALASGLESGAPSSPAPSAPSAAPSAAPSPAAS